jgi:uncharacterized protein (TIGR00299 family) protein
VICVIDPFTGLAGDMLLAALLDAGAPPHAVREAVSGTGLTGWKLTCERVISHGLAASRVRVEVTDPATERSAADLIKLAARARPRPVADVAVAALTAIAEAEARLHAASPDTVHLHELGGHDTLIDVVGAAAALHALGVTQVCCAPLPLATGQVRTAHGILPCPAPATLALLDGAAVTGTDLTGETVTPTAAALLRAVRADYGPPPAMTLAGIGYGAGTRQLADRPNVARVTLGSRGTTWHGPMVACRAPETATEPVDLLETNLDDVTGETLGHVIALALAAGALDAWATPVVMKKGRPGHVLHVLTRHADTGTLLRLVFAETGTLGIRHTATARSTVSRAVTVVDLDGIPVRVKRGPHGAKAEHDDLVAAAAALGLPLRSVADRVARLSPAGDPAEPPACPEQARDMP